MGRENCAASADTQTARPIGRTLSRPLREPRAREGSSKRIGQDESKAKPARMRALIRVWQIAVSQGIATSLKIILYS